MAGGVRIRVVPPERVDYGVHHLVDRPLADVVVLQFLTSAVGSGDDIQGEFSGLPRDRPLILPNDIVAKRADRVYSRQLSLNCHHQQQRHQCNNVLHTIIQIPPPTSPLKFKSSISSPSACLYSNGSGVQLNNQNTAGMVIFACMVAVENEKKEICIVQRDYEVSSIGYLMRNEVKNSFKFVVRESFPCVAKNTRNSVVHEDKVCHIQMSNKPVAAYAFVSQGYPERVIFAFLNKVLEAFFQRVGDKWRTYVGDQNLAIEAITTLFNKYQDPNKADNLMGALEQVQETKVILHESIKKLLERQGDLDKLVEKSKDLSEGAKQFYKTSKKMDSSCCQLI